MYAHLEIWSFCMFICVSRQRNHQFTDQIHRFFFLIVCEGKTFTHHLARICISWRQKQWYDNDSSDRQQRLQCGLGIALLSARAPDAMPTITAMASTARMMKIMTTLDGGVEAEARSEERGGRGGAPHGGAHIPKLGFLPIEI
jgi:hypothetical protein